LLAVNETEANKKTDMKRKNENYDIMSKNPANWRGIFYYNRKDPRIRVPKQDPRLGWTLNFASPYAYLFIIAIMAIIALSIYLGL